MLESMSMGSVRWRRSLALCVTAFVLSLATFGLATTRADAALGDCPSSYSCVWVSTGYSGTVTRHTGAGDGTWWGVSSGTGDSYYNNLQGITLYANALGGGGSVGWVGPYSYGNFNSSFRDYVKSFMPGHCCQAGSYAG